MECSRCGMHVCAYDDRLINGKTLWEREFDAECPGTWQITDEVSTKKQLDAIKRVVKRGDKEYIAKCVEDNRFSERLLCYTCGERSGPEGFAVSDGQMAILYARSIPTLPKDTYLKDSTPLYRLFNEELDHGDYGERYGSGRYGQRGGTACGS